jgi:hypothetical protein
MASTWRPLLRMVPLGDRTARPPWLPPRMSPPAAGLPHAPEERPSRSDLHSDLHKGDLHKRALHSGWLWRRPQGSMQGPEASHLQLPGGRPHQDLDRAGRPQWHRLGRRRALRAPRIRWAWRLRRPARGRLRRGLRGRLRGGLRWRLPWSQRAAAAALRWLRPPRPAAAAARRVWRLWRAWLWRAWLRRAPTATAALRRAWRAWRVRRWRRLWAMRVAREPGTRHSWRPTALSSRD